MGGCAERITAAGRSSGLPAPTTPALAVYYYPRAVDVVAQTRKMLVHMGKEPIFGKISSSPLDVPQANFADPF